MGYILIGKYNMVMGVLNEKKSYSLILQLNSAEHKNKHHWKT